MSAVTAVVVNYETGEHTRRLADELRTQGVDTVVVDNGSDDDLRRWSEKRAYVEYVGPDCNLGYTGGNNIGFKQILDRSEYALVLNPDVHFLDEFNIENLTIPLERCRDLKVLSPRVVNRAGVSLYDPTPQVLKLFVRFGLLPRITGEDPEVTFGYVAPGSCLLIAMDLIEEIGGFDERFFLYREEVEFCLRTLQAGYRVGIHENERVVHEESDGLRHDVDYQMYYNIRNWFLLVRTRFDGWQRPVAYSIALLSVINQMLQVGRSGKLELLIPLIKAVYDGMLGRFGPRRYLVNES